MSRARASHFLVGPPSFRAAAAWRLRRALRVAGVAFVTVAGLAGAEDAPAPAVLDAARLLAGEPQPLGLAWSCAFDAGATLACGDTLLRRASWPQGFPGHVVFRRTFVAEPALVGRALALAGGFTGAAVVRLDGREIARWGDPGPPFRATANPPPAPFVLEAAGPHTVELDYRNPNVARYQRAGWPAGFRLGIAEASHAFAAESARVRSRSLEVAGFAALFLGFAALHLVLWRFNPELPANLEFALLCGLAAALIGLLLGKDLAHTPEIVWWTEPLTNVVGVAFAFTGLHLAYGLFRERRPRRRLWVLGGVAAAIAVWGVLAPEASLLAVFCGMLAAFLEMTREALVAVVRRRSGGVAFAVGVIVLSLGFGAGLLANLGLLPRLRLLTVRLPFSAMALLILCASVALSRRLSEYARRSREMAQARALQLSMLPRALPRVAGVELAAAMETATEVGGDFYDAAALPDGSLVLAIGDATGHGAEAGTLVTAMKGLFGALREEPRGETFLAAANGALLRMGLRPLAMALTWVRLEPGRVRIVGAGTPFPVLIRAATGGATEAGEGDGARREDGGRNSAGRGETSSGGPPGGLPLGLLGRARYDGVEEALAPGDVLVLFTDGFPEAPGGGDGEALGYARAEAIVTRAAREEPSAEALVARLRREAAAWRGGRTLDDDLTFVVARIGDAAAEAGGGGPPR